MLSIHSLEDTGDSWGNLTLTHEVNALLKRLSPLDVCGKITLKTKFYELAFLNTTSMCPPPEKAKTKGALKSVKCTKREPSMWENVKEMSTMVGSFGTPSVAHKVGRDKKKRKMDHYMDEFLDELQQYIMNTKDVTPDENCGYRTIVALLGQGKESWSLICQHLI